MAKILFVADLHGNMVATEALEKEIEKINLKQLGQERLDWLESLPDEDEVLISGINFRLFHGRPVDANYHSYLSMDELRPGFTDTKGKIHGGFISADGHMPYVRSIDLGYRRRVRN